MFFAKQINNNIYVAFTDTSAHSRELLKSIRDKLPHLDKATIKSIENFLKQNEIIDNNARRQQDYISHLKTYIDIVHSDKCMVLHIYVIPKDFDITLSSDDDTNISRLQKLSFDIFKAHKQLTKTSKHDINITQLTSAESFIEMELEFYLSRLNTLYDFLLNYKRTIRDKIIVSDKKVGHEIDNLNILEPNPLKIYQFVKLSYQKDLVVFVYSLISYLKNTIFVLFKECKNELELQKTTDKIYDFLSKISSTNAMNSQQIHKDNLKEFFTRYQNSKEIVKNPIIYEILKEIFHNQLKNNTITFQTINMAKMFEKVVQNKLNIKYKDRLYIGDEQARKFTGNNIESAEILNYKKHLILNHENGFEMPQYPDFIIRQDDLNHIIDAKYKTKDRLYNDSNAFRQIIIYAKLFNKSKDIQKVKKLLIYPATTKIDIDNFKQLKLSNSGITLDDGVKYIENVFNSSLNTTELKYFATLELSD